MYEGYNYKEESYPLFQHCSNQFKTLFHNRLNYKDKKI